MGNPLPLHGGPEGPAGLASNQIRPHGGERRLSHKEEPLFFAAFSVSFCLKLILQFDTIIYIWTGPQARFARKGNGR